MPATAGAGGDVDGEEGGDNRDGAEAGDRLPGDTGHLYRPPALSVVPVTVDFGLLGDGRLRALLEDGSKCKVVLGGARVRAELKRRCGVELQGMLDVQQAHTLLAAAAACRDLQASLGGGGGESGAPHGGEETDADPAHARDAAGLGRGMALLVGSSGGAFRPIDFVSVTGGGGGGRGGGGVRDAYPLLLLRMGVQPPLTAAAARGVLSQYKM